MSAGTKVVRLPQGLAERLLALSREERAAVVERGLAAVPAPAAGGSPALEGETWKVHPLLAAEWAEVMEAAAAERKMQLPFTRWGDNHFRGWAGLLRGDK
jgi:hypothetical protein